MKKLFSIILSVLIVFSFACCSPEKKEPANETPQSTGETEEKLDKIRLFALKGPTGMGLVQLTDNENYDVTIASSPDEITGEIAAGRFEIAAVPTNLAATLYNKTNGKIRVVALNTMGVLFILENGNLIQSVKDLEGKTVGATGQGSTPEYILNYIIEKNNLKNVNVEYYTEHSELMTLMVSKKVDIGMLPQPNVATALAKSKGIRIALDLTEEWEKISTESGLTQGCIIVSEEFAEKYPNALAQFMSDAETSVNFVNRNVADAAEMIAEKGIVPSKEIAESAIPFCNICFTTGNEMKLTLEGFLKVLFDANPKSVGGKMPDEKFYLS